MTLVALGPYLPPGPRTPDPWAREGLIVARSASGSCGAPTSGSRAGSTSSLSTGTCGGPLSPAPMVKQARRAVAPTSSGWAPHLVVESMIWTYRHHGFLAKSPRDRVVCMLQCNGEIELFACCSEFLLCWIVICNDFHVILKCFQIMLQKFFVVFQRHVVTLQCHNVATFQSHDAAMFQCHDVATFQSRDVAMFQCYNVPMFQCRNISMFRCFNVSVMQCCNV